MRPRVDDSEEDEWAQGLKVPVRRKYAKRLIKSVSRELTAAEGNGVVAEIFPNQASVRLDSGEVPRLCGYRMRSLSFGGSSRERSPVCVGDRVRVEASVIVGRCLRRNKLMRSAPNSRDPLLHAVAANLDLLVVVASAREPEFTPGIVDRFLVAASAQHIPALLCVNKCDLLEPGAQKSWSHYSGAGVGLVETDALEGEGTSALAKLIRGKTAAFCGHSGVGKTSLLRRLLGDSRMGRVGVLSRSTGMGKHTTTGAVLLPGPADSFWIDTPGIMNFTFVGMEKALLLENFPELLAASIRCGKDCLHDAEGDCALRGMPRHQSYRNILGSL